MKSIQRRRSAGRIRAATSIDQERDDEQPASTSPTRQTQRPAMISPVPKQRIRKLRVSVTPLTAPRLVQLVDEAAKAQSRLVVLGHNLHSVYLCNQTPAFAAHYERADIVLADGRPVLSALNFQRGRTGSARLPSTYRVGSTDWIGDAVALPSVSRVCILGGSSNSNDRLVEIWSATVPGTEFLGIAADPWDARSLDQVCAQIKSFEPHLVLVGMGMPLQEEVAAQLSAAYDKGVWAAIGGAIDQLSGAQLLAPRWMGGVGIEWLWRLATQPRRLAYRYLVEPWKLIHLLRADRGAQ